MIDDAQFSTADELQGWCDRLGEEGLRGTGSAAHERVLDWIEGEFRKLPGVSLRTDAYEIVRWRPSPEGDLERAGSLSVDGRITPVGGAVPYSLAAERRGELVWLGPDVAITAQNAAGKVVLRDFPSFALPYDRLLAPALHVTPDFEALRGGDYDRPGLADTVLHGDLLAAGEAGAAGIVFAFDIPRAQIAGYFEPHKGTHYRIPAVFIGADERNELHRLAAEGGAEATVAVRAVVDQALTRNLFATLPGQTPEKIILVTHTDGATWVQENGAAALLALARYFSALPIDQRRRTLEFAFTSAHLHISREGSVRYAKQLDAAYDRGEVALVFPIEHLGARELVPAARADSPGHQLDFTGGAEPLLWAVGPSAAIRKAVIDAVTGRALERVVVTPGFGAPVEGRVPMISSFGGLGSNFHTHLLPTTSIITGPWSLWASAFGRDAIDIDLLRRQVLAAGDVVMALDKTPREALAGDYLADRKARAAGAPTCVEAEPPELAPA